MPAFKHRAAYRNWRIDQGFGQPFTLNKYSPQARGLVGWWPSLAFSGGNMLRDLSRLENNGVFPGGAANPTWTRGIGRGMVLSFDGADDYVDVGNDNSLDFGAGAFTIAAWVCPTDLVSTGHIASKMDSAFALGWGLQTYNAGLYVYINGVAADIYADPYFINTNWVHVVVKRESNGDLYIYRDGSVMNVSGSDAGDVNNTDTLKIGAKVGGTYPSYFYGKIDDVRIYNRAITVSEVYQLYAPSTRWDLYQSLPRAFPLVVPAVVSVERTWKFGIVRNKQIPVQHLRI